MTGRTLINNEQENVHIVIKAKYGSLENYYNEVYNVILDILYADEKKSAALLDNASTKLGFFKNELDSFGSNLSNEIITAIKLDVDIDNAQETIHIDRKALDKLEEEISPSLWQRFKNKIGLN